MFEGWPRATGFSQAPSAVISTVDYLLGSPSLLEGYWDRYTFLRACKQCSLTASIFASSVSSLACAVYTPDSYYFYRTQYSSTVHCKRAVRRILGLKELLSIKSARKSTVVLTYIKRGVQLHLRQQLYNHI
jgi:hypothetical protein